MSAIRLGLVLIPIVASTLLHVLPLFVVALLKAALPFARTRAIGNRLLTGIAQSWIGVNNAMLDHFTPTRVDVRLLDGVDLRRDGHYLVLANHQSWVDILVLQKVFNRRIPLLRFFLKRQLFWVPLLGLAWWALDFPFMGRYTPKQIARHPELAGRDIAATRRACEKFRALPVSIMNFVEGTRFTAAKKASQSSPFVHLLKPKSGGVAFVLSAMGEALHAILDVSIAYPAGAPIDARLAHRKGPRNTRARAPTPHSRRIHHRRLSGRPRISRALPALDERTCGRTRMPTSTRCWTGAANLAHDTDVG